MILSVRRRRSGAICWDMPWGKAMNTRSTPSARSALKASKRRPGKAAARLGYRSATCVPAWVSPIAQDSSISGCSKHSLNSSAPA